MARDTDRNAYHTVGMPKDSAAYQRLVQEATESNVSIPSLIALRVADWYRLTASGTVALAAQRTTATTEEIAETHREQEIQARTNAEAAAEAWLD
jgi:hypothetical protein